MVHTALPENPTKKPTIFTTIQTTRHQSLKKFYDQLKKESQRLSKKCLRNSGYKTKLQYQHQKKNKKRKHKKNPNKNNQNKKKRRHNIIWFNPPYSKSVKNNVGRIFIKLTSKHFPPNHKFLKIFNKNTIKISYSCMPNIRAKINSHKKKKILQPKPIEPQKLCNCLVKDDFPMSGLCLTSSISYQATKKCSDSKHKQKR